MPFAAYSRTIRSSSGRSGKRAEVEVPGRTARDLNVGSSGAFIRPDEIFFEHKDFLDGDTLAAKTLYLKDCRGIVYLDASELVITGNLLEFVVDFRKVKRACFERVELANFIDFVPPDAGDAVVIHATRSEIPEELREFAVVPGTGKSKT